MEYSNNIGDGGYTNFSYNAVPVPPPPLPPPQQQMYSKPQAAVDLDDLFGPPVASTSQTVQPFPPTQPSTISQAIAPPSSVSSSSNYTLPMQPYNTNVLPNTVNNYNSNGNNGAPSSYMVTSASSLPQTQSIPTTNAPNSSQPNALLPSVPNIGSLPTAPATLTPPYSAPPLPPSSTQLSLPLTQPLQSTPAPYQQSGVVFQQPQPTPQFMPHGTTFANAGVPVMNPPNMAVAGNNATSSLSQCRSQEDEDKAQLEKIIRLRRELEEEQEREQRKREEMNTWGCPQCTFRNKLSVNECEMCGSARPGFAAVNNHSGSAEPHKNIISSNSNNNNNSSSNTISSSMMGSDGVQMVMRPQSIYAPTNSHPNQSSHLMPNSSISNNNSINANTSYSRTPFTTDWQCSVCATINPPSRANCSACNGYQRNGIPVSTATTTNAPSYKNNNSTNASNQYPVSTYTASANNHSSNNNSSSNANTSCQLPTVWQCSVCTLENPVSLALCSACQSGQRPRHLAPAREHHKNNNTSLNGNSNSSKNASRSGRDGEVSYSEWPCATCTFINRVTRTKCDMCGAARPAKYNPAVHTEKERAAKKREEESDEDEVQWQEDKVAKVCNKCHEPFGLMRRRHHCRACGYVFCADCTPNYMAVKSDGPQERVCIDCYEARKEEDKKKSRKHGKYERKQVIE